MSELSILIPEKTYNINGKNVTIKPFKFKHFNEVLTIIGKYVKAIEDTRKIARSPQIIQEEAFGKDIVSTIFEKVNDKNAFLVDLCRLLELATGLQEDELNNFEYDQVFNIFAIIVKQNIDFFFQIFNQINPPKEAENRNVKPGELKSVA